MLDPAVSHMRMLSAGLLRPDEPSVPTRKLSRPLQSIRLERGMVALGTLGQGRLGFRPRPFHPHLFYETGAPSFLRVQMICCDLSRA